MKTDSYESKIRFNDKWNCFFSLLQFQIDWCNENNDNLKTRQNKKNDQLKHDWRTKHIDEIKWKNNNQCVY
jgi:hypothetical protein